MFYQNKFHEGPDVPPRKDNLYMTPQFTHAPPKFNTYESETYICMNPVPAVATTFQSQPPPPEYDACSSYKMAADQEKLYAEIPGEHVEYTRKEDQSPGEVHYGNVPPSSEVMLKLQHADEEEKIDPNESQ